MKVALFIGKDIDRVRLEPVDTLNKFKAEKLDLKLILSEGSTNPLMIPEEKTDVVIINGHGGRGYLSENGNIVKTAVMPELIPDKTLTIDSIIEIYNKMQPLDFIISGCYQGALINDLKRTIDKFQESTTFFIPASSKYSIHSFESEVLIENLLTSYSSGSKSDPAKLFAQQILHTPQTLFFAKIVKDAETEQKSLIAFKAIGPTHAEGIQNLQEHFTTRTVKEINSSKENLLKNCLITLEGDVESSEYKALYETIDNELRKNNILSKEQSSLYTLKGLFNSILRNKYELVVEWLKLIPEGEEKVKFINSKIKDSFPLHLAAADNRAEIVKMLLEQGANINIQGPHGATALYMASQNGYFHIVEKLLENGADVNIQGPDDNTALFIASQNGHFQVVEKLLENGADVNIQSIDGSTALYMASQSGHSQIVKKLLENEAEVNIKGPDDNTALFIASQNGHFEIVEMLLGKEAEVNIKGFYGGTALFIASQNGHFEIVKKLLENEAEVNIQNTDGVTALLVASQNGHFQIVKLLLEKGADVNAQALKGYTALYMASQNGHFQIVDLLLKNKADFTLSNPDALPPICIAIVKNNLDIADKLIEYGADLNAPMNSGGITPLWMASLKGYAPIVNILLNKYNVKVDALGINKTSALCVAAEKGHIDIVRILIEHKANINIQGTDGNTALYMASQNGHFEIVEMLLGNGANINLPNIDGEAMIKVAVKSGYAKIVKILLKHGADANSTDSNGNSLISIASQKGYTEVIEILKQHLEIDKVKSTHDITSSPIEVEDILYDTLEIIKSTDNTLDVIGNINDHPNSE